MLILLKFYHFSIGGNSSTYTIMRSGGINRIVAFSFYITYMKLSLLQKVLISAQTLYGCNVEKFTATILYAEFIRNDFFTPEKNWEQAMTRRLNELCAMWLIEICSKLDSRSVYRLTRYWKTIDAKKVHVWVTLIMRDPSKELKDMPKRLLKKEKSDRIRKSREEQIVKTECNVLNKNITDILHPMSEKPRHTLRQHILSLFWL